MSTDKSFGSISTKTGTSVLTTSYGTNSAGWTTLGFNVSDVDWLTLQAAYTDHDSATSLSLKVLATDRATATASGASLDSYAAVAHDPDGNGSLTDMVLTRAVSADETFVFTIDARGLSFVRVAALVDDATNSPKLALSYLGDRLLALQESPAV